MTRPDIRARRVGEEGEPVAIVDGFHPDPDALRAAAAVAAFGPGRHHYPGIRAALPPGYVEAITPVLATAVRDLFGHGGVRLLDASFSIVTSPPSSLSTEQRLPHVDAVDRSRIALVHYLDPAGGDGTAFYRHRATGFETVDAGRSPTYFAALADELRRDPPPAAYIADDTAHFARTALVEARYNRAVIYRSAMLHSGAIAPGAVLPSDPATGRLTVTAFLDGR